MTQASIQYQGFSFVELFVLHGSPLFSRTFGSLAGSFPRHSDKNHMTVDEPEPYTIELLIPARLLHLKHF